MGSWSRLEPGLGGKVDSLSRARPATRPQRIRSLLHVAIGYILKLPCINIQYATLSQCLNMAYLSIEGLTGFLLSKLLVSLFFYGAIHK